MSHVILIAKNLCDNTLNHPDYPLEELAQLSKEVNLGRLIFEDLMHLVKCDRYRKASGALFCPALYSAKATISRSAFEDNGIPQWILNNNRFTKMDDGLPLKLFTIQNILHLRSKQKYDLSFSLLPSTLLLESIMNESYTREQRLHLLSIGYSIIFIYFIELEEYTKNSKNPQKTSKSKGKGQCVTLFEKKFCQKYLTLSSALANQISCSDCVDLGALGSHRLEHFFGGIRRISRGNDTSEHFQNRCYDSLLKQIISKNLEIQTTEIKRVSSSGTFLDSSEETTNSLSIVDYIQLAWCLFSPFREQGEFFNLQLFSLATNEGKDIMDEEAAFHHIEEILLSSQASKNYKIISTKKERMIVRSGLINDKRNSEANQISKIKAYSEAATTFVIDEEENDDTNELIDEPIESSQLSPEEIVQKLVDDIENSA